MSGCCKFCKYIVRVKKKPPEKLTYLYCFDFDYTIINDNSDTAVVSVLKNPIPESIRDFYNGENWTEYMDKIMVFIAEQGVDLELIKKKIREIPATPGMVALLEKIRIARLENIGSKFIVISDANDFFIETYLKSLSPPIIPDAIISNHAIGTRIAHKVGENGKELDIPYLKIEPFEKQTQCLLCPTNLCKGQALTNYIRSQGPFDSVFYTGDGRNDVHPGMVLNNKDVLFVRRGFTLEKAIAKKTLRNIPINISAKIVYFTDASEIEALLKF